MKGSRTLLVILLLLAFSISCVLESAINTPAPPIPSSSVWVVEKPKTVLPISTPTQETETCTVTGTWNMREQPGRGASLDYAYSGDTLPVIERAKAPDGGTWIKTDHITGKWINSRACQ